MQKTLILGLMSVLVMSGCSSGDKTAKVKYSANTQIQTVSRNEPMQVAQIQQQQFPTGIPASSNNTDTTGASLAGMTDAPTPITTPVTPPNANNPPSTVTSTTTTATPTPSTATQNITIQSIPLPDQNNFNSQGGSMPAPSPTVSTTTVTAPNTDMPSSSMTPSNDNSTAKLTAPSTGGQSNTVITPVTLPPSAPPSGSSVNNAGQSSPTTQDTYSEQYEDLPNPNMGSAESATTTLKPKPVPPNFDNVAIPVTFSNSPYNKALDDYNSAQTAAPTAAPATSANQSPTTTTTTTTNNANNGATQ